MAMPNCQRNNLLEQENQNKRRDLSLTFMQMIRLYLCPYVSCIFTHIIKKSAHAD
jgi:hypothetical protein